MLFCVEEKETREVMNNYEEVADLKSSIVMIFIMLVLITSTLGNHLWKNFFFCNNLTDLFCSYYN